MKIQEPAYYHTKIKDWPEGERPREKLMQLGPEHLSESELLAILLRTGSRTQTAVDLAKTIVARCGNLFELSTLNYRHICRIKGIGTVKAVTLAAAFEAGRRVASIPIQQKFKVSDPEVIFQRYGPILQHLKKEVFMLMALNTANLLIRDIRISEGTLNASLVHPREVFKAAILESAASVILLHNHPSGEVQPSAEDRRITDRLTAAGKLLDIPVLDHIIIGTGKYFSFREAGMIEE